MQYNIRYWWFFFSQGNRRTKYLAYHKILRPKPCLVMLASLVALDGFHLLLSTQPTDCRFAYGIKWWIHVSSIVTYLCKNSFLLRWYSCKQRSESSIRCFLIDCEQTCTHFEHSFLNDKCSSKIVNTLRSDIFNSFTISRNFNLRSAKRVCRVFWCFSGHLPNLGDLSVMYHLCLYDRV